MWNSVFSVREIVGGASRRGIFWRGVLILVMGVLLALKPLLATVTLSVLFGCGFVAWGFWTIISAFQTRRHQVLWSLYGILLFLCGGLLLTHPMVEMLALAWSVAALFLSSGVIGISISLASGRTTSYNLFAFTTSIFSILMGIMLFIWPLIGLIELIWVVGILLAVEGLILIVFSFRIPAGKKTVSFPAENSPVPEGKG